MLYHPSFNKSDLLKLKAKEIQCYNALSALIDLIEGHQKHIHEYKPSTEFDCYKHTTLMRMAQLNLHSQTKPNQTQENQFNLMHYKRAILTASQPNYRNMAILAAKHNLTTPALAKLLNLVKKACIKLSKETKIIERRLLLRKQVDSAKEAKSNTHDAVMLVSPLKTAPLEPIS